MSDDTTRDADEAAETTDTYERSRRDFLELCARMSVTVPPAVMLLASSREALASHGAAPDSGGDGDGGGSVGGGAPFDWGQWWREWLRRWLGR